MRIILGALQKYWGYDSFLPLQEKAMAAVRGGRDCIVVLPTGGGKSLCYQAPAVTMEGTAVVVSPLISLMKDQVDALAECGVAAARIDSSLSLDEHNDVIKQLTAGELKLIYVAPERLVSQRFVEILRRIKLSFIAVDEAHCVSMWGHDFRPEYRQLGGLKKLFGGVTIAAYTATATEHVRDDIAEQLKLDSPELLIGSFDRPNLVYRVTARLNAFKQITEVLDRHQGESGIIYCIRRKDVDSMCADLKRSGYKVAGYHAGMTDEQRKKSQDMFIREKVDIIAATVAFGMGIDKSNVRFVIHAGMPKSLEHYQQESGRAGRDGLEAECCLFYGGNDYGTWKYLLGEMEGQAHEIAMTKLNDMYGFCTGGLCRHRAILQYFGQDLDKDNCQACDVCLDDVDCLEDSLVTAQKILSCILRLDQRFGAGHTAMVLTGSTAAKVMENRHDELSTYGLLGDRPAAVVRNWVEQLVGQGCIEKVGEYNTLSVTAKGWQVIRGELTPRLIKPPEKPVKASRRSSQSWEGVDRQLFEKLRELRRSIADDKGVPAFVIFGDVALRDMACRRPSSLDGMLEVKGVGRKKLQQYGKVFLDVIKEHCRSQSLETDRQAPASSGDVDAKATKTKKLHGGKAGAVRKGAAKAGAKGRGKGSKRPKPGDYGPFTIAPGVPKR